MNQEFTGTSASTVAVVRGNLPSRSARRIRQIAAATTALTFMLQNMAWATCTDGSTFPSGPGGFSLGVAPVTSFSPNIFTNTLGSVWIPDVTVTEFNLPGGVLTGNGHDFVFDQGTATCKMVDDGPAGGTPTSWWIPTINGADCVLLPVVKGGFFVGIGDLPQRNDILTPTCDPTILSQPGAPNPANTRLNQLGCSLSHGVATTPQTAMSFLFVSGIKSGLFNIPLENSGNTFPGGDAGKIVAGLNFYSANNVQNGKLDSAAISPDGQFLFGASSKNNANVFACLNPLGDPGDPSQPINPAFFPPPASAVLCMSIGNALNSKVEGLAAGSDGQPYMANNVNVTNFVNFPGCIWKNNGSKSLLDAFQNNRQNGCGNAVPNDVMNSAFNGSTIIATGVKAETQGFVSHNNYIYRALKGGPVVQFKLTVSSTGVTTVTGRNYGSFGNPTGIGFSDGINSMVVYTDPSAIGATDAEVLARMPICEDM